MAYGRGFSGEAPVDGIACDALVIGSGAAGMTAALAVRHAGLEVVLVEKDARYGGTAAISGGWLWVPGNPVAVAAGFGEEPEAARTYLRYEAGACFDEARVDAFLEHGPRMVEFLMRETAVRFLCPPAAPDYHAQHAGGVKAGRSIMTEPFDGRALGAHIAGLRPPLPELTVLGMMLGSGRDVMHFMRATRSLESAAFVARRLARHLCDTAVHGRGMQLTNGNALAGRLAKSLHDMRIPLWLSSPARQLLVTAGAVHGAIVERAGRPVRIEARRGVVLACGGFSQDIARRRLIFPHERSGSEHCSMVSACNTGDGLRLAESAGGFVDATLPNAAAWAPVSRVARADGTVGLYPHFIDRAKPGVIAVIASGERFVNEGCSYHDFVQAMVQACGGTNVFAHLVCDHRAIRRYGLGMVRPAPFRLRPHLDTGYLLRGATLPELAARAGIDAAALSGTVDAFNLDARRGRDTRFGKGDTPYSRHMGDAFHHPHPGLAPLDAPPYYAVKVWAGDLGTFAGLATDPHARVLDSTGRPVPGLYAAGNDMASVMGGGYPGAGAMLGAGMTFAYIAGRSLAHLP